MQTLLASRGGRGAPSGYQKRYQLYPIGVLADRGIVEVRGTGVYFVEPLDRERIASLLAALDERAVRTEGLRVENSSWWPDKAEWQRLRRMGIERDGQQCPVAGCHLVDDLHLVHIL